ncbi:MAG TPA: hypothetical protein VM123_17880 [archaeon]|nr:hypothetical protein [archaeon]
MRQVSFLLGTLLFCVTLTPCLVSAQAPPKGFSSDEIYTRITTSRIHRYKLVVAPMPVEGISLPDSIDAAMQLKNIIIDDLDFSLRFDVMNRRINEFSLLSLNSAKDRVGFKGWQSTGAEYLVAGSFFEIDQTPMVEIRVYDLSLEDLVFLKNYTLDFARLRRVAHHIADDIVLNVTGERGIASTRIALIIPISKDTRELFYCDYDGYDLSRVTHDSSIAMIPSWSPDGNKISYTSHKGADADLYLADLKTGKNSVLQAAKGVDMAASWCASNGFCAFSSGVTGNQEIYYLRPGEVKPVRITFSYAMDIEPTWSPNGMEIAFASTRAGNPQIFIMDSDGLNLRRLTFESRNFTPSWRPLPFGDKILLTSEIRGLFQIAIIDVNGENFIQLTTDGENRAASWSPDGLHIVFSSDRRGGRGNPEIFTMDWDGNSQRPLNKNFRPGKEPGWSPFLDW